MLANLRIFTQNSDNHFCCLTSSNVLFIQLLAFCWNWEQRREKNCIIRHFPEISKKKYRNRIPELGTTISGLPIIKLKKKIFRPTDPRFFLHVTVNTHNFCWPCVLFILVQINRSNVYPLLKLNMYSLFGESENREKKSMKQIYTRSLPYYCRSTDAPDISFRITSNYMALFAYCTVTF